MKAKISIALNANTLTGVKTVTDNVSALCEELLSAYVELRHAGAETEIKMIGKGDYLDFEVAVHPYQNVVRIETSQTPRKQSTENQSIR